MTGQQTVIGDVAGASVNLRITFIMPEMPASRNPPKRASNCIPLGELLADADHRGLDVEFMWLRQYRKFMTFVECPMLQ